MRERIKKAVFKALECPVGPHQKKPHRLVSYDEFTDRQINNIKKSFDVRLKASDLIIMFDDGVIASGKHGILFTKNTIYYNLGFKVVGKIFKRDLPSLDYNYIFSITKTNKDSRSIIDFVHCPYFDQHEKVMVDFGDYNDFMVNAITCIKEEMHKDVIWDNNSRKLNNYKNMSITSITDKRLLSQKYPHQNYDSLDEFFTYQAQAFGMDLYSFKEAMEDESYLDIKSDKFDPIFMVFQREYVSEMGKMKHTQEAFLCEDYDKLYFYLYDDSTQNGQAFKKLGFAYRYGDYNIPQNYSKALVCYEKAMAYQEKDVEKDFLQMKIALLQSSDDYLWEHGREIKELYKYAKDTPFENQLRIIEGHYHFIDYKRMQLSWHLEDACHLNNPDALDFMIKQCKSKNENEKALEWFIPLYDQLVEQTLLDDNEELFDAIYQFNKHNYDECKDILEKMLNQDDLSDETRGLVNYNLGLLHENGYILYASYASAMLYYLEASDLGVVLADYHIARMRAKDPEDPSDVSAIYNTFTELVDEFGDSYPSAYLDLANVLENGIGVEKNEGLANQYRQKGYAYYQKELAERYHIKFEDVEEEDPFEVDIQERIKAIDLSNIDIDAIILTPMNGEDIKTEEDKEKMKQLYALKQAIVDSGQVDELTVTDIMLELFDIEYYLK